MKIMFKNLLKIVFDFITLFLITSNFDRLNDLRIDFLIKFCFRIKIFMNVNCWDFRIILIRRFFLKNLIKKYSLSIFSITYRKLKFNVFRIKNFFFIFEIFDKKNKVEIRLTSIVFEWFDIFENSSISKIWLMILMKKTIFF